MKFHSYFKGILVLLIFSCQDNTETDVHDIIVGKWTWFKTSFSECLSSDNNLIEELCYNLYCPRINITGNTLSVYVPELGPKEFTYVIKDNQIELNDGADQYDCTFQLIQNPNSYDYLALVIPGMYGGCTQTWHLSRDFGDPVIPINTIFGPWKQNSIATTDCANEEQNGSIACSVSCSNWMITTERIIITEPDGQFKRYFIDLATYGEIVIINQPDTVISNYIHTPSHLRLTLPEIPWMGNCNATFELSRY